jgi:hypothetical protein
MRSIDRAIAELAEPQYGAFHRRQALASGIGDDDLHRRLGGSLELIYPTVFRHRGAPPSWRQRLMAACLLGGPGSAVSHRAAAALLGLDRYRKEVLEITVPRPRRHTTGDVLVHRARDLLAIDVVPIAPGEPLLVTTPARTILDLAGVDRDVARVGEALDSAIRKELTTADAVRWRVQALRKRGRAGVRVMDALLAEREAAPLPESPLERRFLRLLADADLPPPVCQYELRRPDGRFVARVDCAYPEQRLAIELYGHAYHSSVGQRDRDMVRENDIDELGWSLRTFSYRQVNEQRGYVAATVRRALGL